MLAELRLKVTVLEAELKEELLRFQTRVRSLETQRSDLELQIRRDSTQIEHIQSQIEEMSSLLSPTEQEAELEQSILQTAAQLKASILDSLPYRHEERIQSIEEIEQKMNSKELSPGQAAVRLWNVLEDEKRLNRENILDKDTIVLDGKAILVQLARLGMMAEYFQGSDGRIGFAQRNGSQWSWVEITDSTQKEAVQQLFSTLQKGVRSGTYVLPNALFVEK